MRTGWIYAIIDENSGKSYVGQTCKHPKYRWTDHKRNARQGKHHPLYHAMAKRPEAFHFVVVGEFPEEHVSAVERDMILLAGSLHPHGYNLQEGGLVSYRKSEMVRARQRGKKASEETRRKLRESHLGHRPSPETIAKIAAAHRGMKRPRDAVERTRLAQKGRKVSERQKEQLRQANLGKRHSAETRAKMSVSHIASDRQVAAAALRTGKKLSVETRERMRAAHSTPEALAKSAAATRGRVHSKDTRKRMVESHRLGRIARQASLPTHMVCVGECKASLALNLENFAPDKRATSGLTSCCRACQRARNASRSIERKQQGWRRVR